MPRSTSVCRDRSDQVASLPLRCWSGIVPPVRRGVAGLVVALLTGCASLLGADFDDLRGLEVPERPVDSAGLCEAGRASCTEGAACGTDLATDPEHCGRCGNACSPSEVCGPQGCATSCPGSLARCGRSCVSLDSDETHCGQCGRECPAPPAGGVATCEAGQCGVACRAGYVSCPSGCCPAPGQGGACGPGTCDGCCSGGVCRPGNDATACGSKGEACNACVPGSRCVVGRCGPAPLVMFGGRIPSGGSGNARSYAGDTWEWNGTSWTQKATSGPAARAGHAMASLGGKAVLFGGYAGLAREDLGDTWEWDGVAWSLRSTTGPSARRSHAMASLGGKVVLFGGHAGGQDLSDTWEWDGATWTQKSIAGPSARHGHAMALVGSKVVLFGGIVGDSYLEDTWEWNGSTWTNRGAPGPARNDHAMAVLGNKLVLFGGGYQNSDTWEWDGGGWTERKDLVAHPSGRARHAMGTFDGKVLLVGGEDYLPTASFPSDVCWEWSGSSWKEQKFSCPPPRSGHAMTSR